MRATFTVVGPAGDRREVVAHWSGAVTVGDLLAGAGVALPYAGAAVWVDGRATAPDERLDTAGLYSGAVVGLSPAASPAPADPAAGLHLAVVGGAASGAMAPLRPGRCVVGRAPDCDLRVADRAVSSHHLALDVRADGAVTAEDLGSSNGTLLDGAPLVQPVAVAAGQLVGMGDTLVEVRPGAPPDAVLHPVDGGLEVRRPPRLLPAPGAGAVAWPSPPAPPTGHSIPLASALVPLLLGGVLYAFTHQVLMLLFVLMSPLLAVSTTVTDRRSGKSRYRREMADYREEVARAETETTEALRAEGRVRRAADPDPAAIAAIASGPRRRLWERRRGDDDFLRLRVGLAALTATTRRRRVVAFGVDEFEDLTVPAAPATVSFTASGVVGVAGPAAPGAGKERVSQLDASGLAAWMVAQAAVLCGPSDLRVVVLAPPAGAGDDGRGQGGASAVGEQRWGWCRWLPHVLPAAPGEAPGLGTTASSVETRVRELVELVEQRHRSRERPGASLAPEWPAVLAVLDPAHDVRRVAGAEVVLQRGPEVGVYALCVEEADGFLPAECQAVVTVGADNRGVLRSSGHPDVDGIMLDGVDPAWLETVGRALGPLVDPEVRAAGGAIPTAVRLVDMVEAGSPDAVIGRWAAGGRSTRAVVGAGIDGPFAVDLRADGPHGLVAGTTGAGKSEFLQTLVTSLAVVNRPDALNFLLVDYKGGSAFRDCARLPHTVGVVTDLDGHLTERALASLSAELKRREELLARGGAKDIDDYIDMGEPVGALPRLLIVIDEFAGLVAELPEFVTGLVGIAQRGRSLGIHLILATQRPSGVVSPEIRANTNLRVALRVTSPAESVDIIDAPDA
ncbi:MAG TPA: FtsK/SpoIIIE domain-containing protein, partial [Acidimicrobiales bacterium]|nr:FtsK/SpoIIIE domain-containing protein [Acidimicrobiales bacterium]